VEKHIKKAEKHMKRWHGDIGPPAYFLGVLVAVFAGFAIIPEASSISFLAALGVIVGLLNVDDEELEKFLLASLTFLFCAVSLSNLTYLIPVIGDQIRWVLYFLTAFAAPAAAVVSLKAIHEAGHK
jgi:hypothetical protein